VAATLPYVWLIENFGYDDILREPAAVVLQRFNQGGSPLVLAWLAFAMSALLFTWHTPMLSSPAAWVLRWSRPGRGSPMR